MPRPIGTTFICGKLLKLLKYTLNSDYHADSQSKEAYFESFSKPAIGGWLWVLALPLDAALDKADIERRFMTNAPANWHNSYLWGSPLTFKLHLELQPFEETLNTFFFNGYISEHDVITNLEPQGRRHR